MAPDASLPSRNGTESVPYRRLPISRVKTHQAIRNFACEKPPGIPLGIVQILFSHYFFSSFTIAVSVALASPKTIIVFLS